MTVNIYIRTESGEVRKYDSFTEEEKKEIGKKLNEQVRKSVVLRPKTA